MTVSIPHVIANGQPTDGDKLGANFAAVQAWSTGVDSQLAQVPGLATPVGVVVPYSGVTAPTGWLLADGSAVSRTTYANLFAVIGTTFGAGNGSTTFNLPNLKGRFPVGRDALTSPFVNLAATGGSKDAAVVAHTHPIDHVHPQVSTSSDGAHSHNVSGDSTLHLYDNDGTGNSIAAGPFSMFWQPALTAVTTSNGIHTHTVPQQVFTGTSGSAGGSATDANLPPYLVLNFIVKT